MRRAHVGRRTAVILNIEVEIELGQLCKEEGVSERRGRDAGHNSKPLPVTSSSSSVAACADASAGAPDNAMTENIRLDSR